MSFLVSSSILGLTLVLFFFAVTPTTAASHDARDVISRRKRSDDVSVGNLQTLLEQQAVTIQQQAASIQQLQSRLAVLEGRSLPSTFKQVAFTAGLASDILNLGQGQIIKFDHPITNVGNGYSPLTGMFTAPVAGLYAFSLSFMSVMGHDHTYIAIDKDGTMLGAAFADGRADWDQGSATVTTHLTQGQRVYARQLVGSSIRGADDILHTSVFSGFLVQAD